MEKKSRMFGKNCTYNLNYHIVWCPKRRSPVLVEDIAKDLQILLAQSCKEIGVNAETLNIMPDHVHIFVSAPPKISPHKIVKKLKGKTSNFLRQKYPQLLKLPALWSSSYYIGSVGYVSESIVRMYIENQKGK